MRDKHLGRTMTRGGRLSSALLVFAATLLAADWAGAQLRVSSIDWVQGRPEIPHPALNNRATILMAIAEGGGCGGNYQYRWDINGDGDFDDGNEGWRGTNSGGHRSGRWAPLGLEITFPAQPGDRTFYPKVEVDCAGERASTVVPYLVRVDRMCPNYPNDFHGGCRAEKDENIKLTRQYYYDRIVDRMMWWMFNHTNHYSDDGRRGGIHACTYFGGMMYNTGHYLNVYLRRSHGYGPGRDVDAYYRHAVYCGLNALVGTYTMSGGSWFNDDGADGWDGWRMSYTNARLGGHWGWGSYGSTAWVEPVVNYGNASYRVPGGEGNVRGRTLRDLGGDLRDGVLYCMAGSGQWYYSCRADGHPDASTNGWAPESMRILGRKFGMNTYGWARDRQRNWLNGNCSSGSNNDHNLFGCRYHVHGPGGVGKLAGNALVGYGWTQLQDFNNNTGDARWRMREHWIAASRLDNVWHGLYFLYATTKGMRSFVPELAEMEGGRDWATEFAHYLVTHLVGDNYSNWCAGGPWGCHWCCRGSFNYYAGTALTAQMIQTWLEAQAMARANPQSTGPGIPVTFDHSWSHILDPLVTLTRFRWNVIDHGNEGRNGVGSIVWDFTTADLNETFEYTFDANLGWTDVINKKIILEVTDSNGNTVYDDKSVSITLSLKNHKPVVVSHPAGRDGIYSGYFGQRFMLDASKSYETDQCIRDREDPNLPGGNAEIIEPPEAANVQIQDCDALENEMNRCLDNANPANVNEILACVEMQYELKDCRLLENELAGCNGFQSAITACEALIALPEDQVPEDVEQPENCDPEIAALQQCRTEAVATVNATIDAANLAEFNAQVGGDGGAVGDAAGNCGDREVFPGDGTKPPGIPDKITSICFDTNFNNRWCEPGEIQYMWPDGAAAPTVNDPVEFVPRAGMGEGDIIGVPVRVCDDGRWNGKCYHNGDGAPGHLTRGDCSECGYGTASLQVINNTTGPTVQLTDPPAAPAKGRISVIGAPDDNDFVDVTNTDGDTTRVVIDRDTDVTTVTRPTTVAVVNESPLDGDTFKLRDHTGNERRYVFRPGSERVDGSTSDLNGIPHIQVGTSGAGGTAGVAERLATAVTNTGALDISAVADGNRVTLTQNSTAHTGNTKVEQGGSEAVAIGPFIGGLQVGIRSVQNDTDAMAQRIASAIDNNIGGVSSSTSNNVVSLAQQTNGFSGNTELSNDDMSNVRTTDFSGGRPSGYDVAPGQRIQLDLSASRDPEGVLGAALDTNGVYYRYELLEGRGYILPEPGYERKAAGRDDNSPSPDDWSNWGARPLVVPRGDGPRRMVVRVSARDVGGRATNQDVVINLINERPVIKTLDADVRARAPRLDEDQAPPIDSLGNRRYRLVVEAVPDTGVDAVLRFSAIEKYEQPLTATADLDGDGNPDTAPAQGADGEIRGEFEYVFRDLPPEGRTVNSSLHVSDGHDTVVKTIRVFVPAISPEAAENIRYTIDIGNDGSLEVVDSRQNWAEFRLPPGNNTVEVAGFVSANQARIPFNLGQVEMPNAAPVFSNPRLVSHEGFDVVLAASATDPDGDPITYTVDWGDGNQSRGTQVVYSHSYQNSAFRAYNIRVRATDDRGLFDEHVLTVDIVRPATKEADVSSLAWRRMTEAEGTHDGVRGFAIDSAGTLFTHNYMGIIRRSTDGGDTWRDLLEDVECCGNIVTRDAGEVFIASPNGLYFSGDNGDNWALFDESKYLGVAISPDQNYVVAATLDTLKRFDMTGRLIDSHVFAGDFEDIDACAPTGRSAFTTQTGQLFTNDRRDMNPAGWRIPEARFGKDKGASSVSFDKACNLYQGIWNGYRKLNADNSIEPSSIKVPKHLFHISGSHTKNVYGGVGDINDILAWPNGAVIVGAERGIWGENEPWNAYQTPYWKKRDRGLDRSMTARRLEMHPTNGFAYAAMSSAVQMPKYCRKARRNARGRRRGRRRSRTSYYYVFCGFTQNYQGGLYRSDNPLLLSRTVGDGGSGFDPLYARSTAYDGNAGGLVVQLNQDQPTFLWLVDTSASTMTKWDPSQTPPLKIAEYRVGIPQGECPGSCCFEEGCNMPSRVSVDDLGNAYVASRGFGIQGTVSKIAGALEDCVDRNNNGSIETSRDGNPMAYGADECVLWTVPVGRPNALLRAMTIDLGSAQVPDGFVWVGGYNTNELYKLHPDDGRLLATVPVPTAPYGLTIVNNGDLYMSTLGDGTLVRIDTAADAVAGRIANPRALRDGAVGSYGITTDTEGRIWQNGWDTMDAIGYDPADGSWCRVAFPAIIGGAQAGRGITVAPDGRLWTALGGDGASHVAYWDGELCRAGQTTQIPRGQVFPAGQGLTGPSAIGADSDGNIWLAHNSVREMVKIEPANNFAMTRFENGALVHSFTDITGVVRRLASGQGTYEHDFEAECDAPTWTALDWSALVPVGASVSFSVQTAAQRNKLVEGTNVEAGRAPGDPGPINIGGRLNAVDVASRRFLRVKATLRLGDGQRSPVLQNFTVRWNCD